MSRITNSGFRNEISEDMVGFLRNFQTQNKRDEYSIDEFFTFLQMLPLQQTSQLTLDQRAQVELSHRIMVTYLRQKLSEKGRKMTFRGDDLMRVLQRDDIDPKQLTDICEKQSREDVVNTVGTFIRRQSEENKDFNQILGFLRTFIKGGN